MKKGQIVSVSHQLPFDCPYKSYRELKRFWKNTVSAEFSIKEIWLQKWNVGRYLALSTACSVLISEHFSSTYYTCYIFHSVWIQAAWRRYWNDLLTSLLQTFGWNLVYISFIKIGTNENKQITINWNPINSIWLTKYRGHRLSHPKLFIIKWQSFE